MRKLSDTRFFQVLVYSSESEADMEKINEYYQEFSTTLFHKSENTTNLIGFLNELCFMRVELKPLIENMDDIDQHLPKFEYFKKVLDLLDYQIAFTEKRFKYDNNSNKTSKHQNISEDVEWTGFTVQLIELGYALKATKSINNGHLEIKEIMELLSRTFNTEIKDYYNVYHKMKGRAGDQTIFLDHLKDMLMEKMIDDLK
jgi:hypothetical protein